MRGVVTLAAAFVIERDTEYREVLLLIALTVVAGTLFIQGMTLPLLARRLKVPGPDPAEDALARATLLQQASKAAMKELEKQEYDDRHGVIDLITQRLEQRNFAAWERLATVEGQESPSDQYNRIRQAMIQAERERVLEIRDAGSVPSEVVEDVLAMLDIEESMLDLAAEDRAGLQNAMSVRRTGDSCDDLEQYPAVDTVEDPAARPASTWASRGSRCASASVAVTSAAATRHRCGTPPSTSTRRRTRSWSPPSPARTGAGASCTTRRRDHQDLGSLACGSPSSGMPASASSTTGCRS